MGTKSKKRNGFLDYHSGAHRKPT